MKTKREHASPGPAPTPREKPIGGARLGSSKIHPQHLTKLAIVYVRQSSPQQVLENRESTARQYALADHAAALGWPAERVLVIDEDQGCSGGRAEHRDGFQRLLAEVTMDHVGMVLGLEMSRLARSSKDWHHLLELCSIFSTLLGDQDGIYDPRDPNDRLLLGLKGTISEVELHTMRNRLERGRMNKAERGELFNTVSRGYVRLPNGQVVFDSDEQVQAVVRLIFEKFDELGTLHSLFQYLVRQGIQLPIRVRSGLAKGQLEWRRPTPSALAFMIHHPIYAGAYTHGRRAVDPRAKLSGQSRPRQKWVPMDQWKVLLQDHLPAYITWEQYLRNQQRLKQNRSGPEALGSPRQGCALLPRLVVCGTCSRRMEVRYRRTNDARYVCVRHLVKASEQTCYGLSAGALDELVSQQVLRAIEPAAVELSLQARNDVQRERARLDEHWRQQLKRAGYDADLAGRRYQAVDPSNRLVAATLEKSWEDALRAQSQVQDEYDRFQRETPRMLSEDECAAINAAAADIVRLWNSPRTSNVDRQEIIRCLVERVEVQVRHDSEYVDATIHWAGGYTSQHQFVRSVATYAQLHDFEELLNRVAALRCAGNTAAQIAKQLNTEGFHPPKGGEFTKRAVQELLFRRGLTGKNRDDDEFLDEHEWWLGDLSRKLKTTSGKLADWTRRGWLHSRRTPIQHKWILWADDEEIARLEKLLATSQRGVNGYPGELTTPKTRRKRQ